MSFAIPLSLKQTRPGAASLLRPRVVRWSHAGGKIVSIVQKVITRLEDEASVRQLSSVNSPPSTDEAPSSCPLLTVSNRDSSESASVITFPESRHRLLPLSVPMPMVIDPPFVKRQAASNPHPVNVPTSPQNYSPFTPAESLTPSTTSVELTYPVSENPPPMPSPSKQKERKKRKKPVSDESSDTLKQDSSKTKVRKRKEKAQTPAENKTSLSLYQAVKARSKRGTSKRDGVSQAQDTIKFAGWMPEDWKDSWRGDDFQSPGTPLTSAIPRATPSPISFPVRDGKVVQDLATTPAAPPQRRFARHHQAVQGLPPYTRRIDGLLLPMNDKEVILEELTPPSRAMSIATLAHGLDRVLFNPGIHWLQDPRSRVYNFDPVLQAPPDVREFAFERLGAYVPSSRDEDLIFLANAHEKRFVGSTSSLTGIISHIYFLISEGHKVDVSTLSQAFTRERRTFSPGQRMPVSLLFHHQRGTYAIDSNNNDDFGKDRNILMWMGIVLERFLTLPQEGFTALLRSSPIRIEVDQSEQKEAYRYSKSKNFVMRSQLDCHDPRLPGSGVFDIKTRAALPLRLDGLNYKENSGYLIRTLYGPLESFEKEYYDLIRSAFLKYSFQARIGNMDGIFLAYHNTARLFGFQYVPLDEMEERLFGAHGRGDRVFHKCIGLLEAIAEEIVACFPDKSVTCTVETPETEDVMHLWVQPEEWLDSQADSPIAQLDVSTTSYIGSRLVGGAAAVDDVENPWTLHWSIRRSSLPVEAIRKNLDTARLRTFRAYNIPTGVSPDKLSEHWAKLDFRANPAVSDISSQTDIPLNNISEIFREPNANIRMLRDLARVGHSDIGKWAAIEKDKRKVVWGQPDYVETVEDNEKIEERPLDVYISSVVNAVATTAVSRVPEDVDMECTEELLDTTEDAVGGGPQDSAIGAQEAIMDSAASASVHEITPATTELAVAVSESHKSSDGTCVPKEHDSST